MEQDKQGQSEGMTKISFDIVILRLLDRMNDRVLTNVSYNQLGGIVTDNSETIHVLDTDMLYDYLIAYLNESDLAKIKEISVNKSIDRYQKSRAILRVLMLRLHSLNVLFQEKIIPEM